MDIFNKDNLSIGKKGFYADLPQSINKWIKKFDDKGDKIGLMVSVSPDFQHNLQLAILSKRQERYCFNITKSNLIPFCVYFAVRHTIEATWLNDRDQFLHPNDEWIKDKEFQTDCLAFTLFHPQNRISSKKSPSLAEGDLGGGLENINHFIPFDEGEIKAKEGFKSDFMYRFLHGKLGGNSLTTHPQTPSAREGALPFDEKELNTQSFIPTSPLEFSPEARAVFAAVRELWRHYHAQDFKDPAKPYNANASLYDIKAFFQGFNEKGKMNAPQKAANPHYKDLLGALNSALRELAKQKIEEKIYDYGFLRE